MLFRKMEKVEVDDKNKKDDLKPTTIKYYKPKILLIDMNDECANELLSNGYNVSKGSFGKPYRVNRSNNMHFVSLETSCLPNLKEQEIVFVNIGIPEVSKDVPPNPDDNVNSFWTDGQTGLIDPRPLFMNINQNNFKELLNNEVIFIVFAANNYSVKYDFGHLRSSFLQTKETNNFCNWCFIDKLTNYKVNNWEGEETNFGPKSFELTKLLSSVNDSSYIEATVDPTKRFESKYWVSLGKNKNGNDIAGIHFFGDPRKIIVILPQMPEFHRIIVEFLETWCVLWKPKFFSELEKHNWLYSKLYELSEVLEKKSEIELIQKNANEMIKSLEIEIENIRQEKKDWYTLLSGTGDELQKAIIRTLRAFGFKYVIDVDEEAEKSKTSLKEDIRIEDKSPILVIDAKGINSFPSDEDIMQAFKHASIRTRAFSEAGKCEYSQALSIINHQRHLPPHDREKNVFRKEIIDNAKDHKQGLITTLDLHFLYRNKMNLGWTSDQVKPIFYRTGKIEPIPEHYLELGTIQEFWKEASAIGVKPLVDLRQGAKLAVEKEKLFFEFVANSLQVHGSSVSTAPKGSECGIGVKDAKVPFSKGMKIFLVSED